MPAGPTVGRLTVLCILSALAASSAAGSFIDHGIGAEVAELRSMVPTVTEDGRTLLIASPTDNGPTGYLLVTDLDTGETTQHLCPEDVPQFDPFGALLHSNGMYYHTQGPILLEFDPSAGEFTFHGRPSRQTSPYLCFTEGLDGTVWAGGVYNTGLISYDPRTREMVDHGRMDDVEQYLSYLAEDDAGWVYCGIGTSRSNIVAYHPASGERRSLIDEELRSVGTGYVEPLADGSAYGRIGSDHHFHLHDGVATPIGERAEVGERRDVTALRYGSRLRDLPDGRQIREYDLHERRITVLDPATGEAVEYTFDYESGGVNITSLGPGPDGVIYGSTSHPMHFLALDTTSGELTDMGPIPQVGGGNFCAITSLGDLVFGAQYAAGQLWEYDATKPWNPTIRRQVRGVQADEMYRTGTVVGGRLSYLAGHDVVFIIAEDFGAEASFPLRVEEPGEHYLHVQPYLHEPYCTVQFLFNGEEIGEPFDPSHPETRPGPVQVFGPMQLEPGEHSLGVRLLETEGREPWFSLVSADLSLERHETLLTGPAEQNPRVLARWAEDVARPRTALVHPDGVHVMMAGFAGYGRVGGGIGIYSLETGEDTLLTAADDLLPGHSCITLEALPDGDLVGGTSITAPGGGHPTAEEAELLILDWESKEVILRTVPVAGDRNIISIHVLDGLVYGFSGNSTFFVFDPAQGRVVHSESLREFGGVPRHALQAGDDGFLYAMLRNAIVRITPGSFECEKLADTEAPATAGGALVGERVYYASGSRVWSYEIPGN
ncbi:MAG: hypothetical protein ACOX9R_14250 [Armatimonadota bacterium]|jgi:hypothetical protein